MSLLSFSVKMFGAILYFILFINPILCISISKPCKINEGCIDKIGNAALQEFYSGIPAVTEKMDPLFIELDTGTVAGLNYKFLNRTITGQKECSIKNIKVDNGYTNLKFQLECPSFKQDGKYELDGSLLIVPVHGKGDYTMKTGKYLVDFSIDIKKYKGSDGKNYIGLKTFNVKHTGLEPIEFDFKHLFDGNKDLSDAIHNFAHENWKELGEILNEPVMHPVWEKILKNVNKYLKTLPIDDIISN